MIISFPDSVKPYNMLSHLEKNSNLTKQTAIAITGQSNSKIQSVLM